MSAESMIWGALKAVGVVHRESFTLATFDSETDERSGSVSAREVAAEVVRWLDLCSAHAVTDCEKCAGRDEEVGGPPEDMAGGVS